ncbi:hypothetical protein [Proteus mirabilis]|uniref:hypothetical protein n=1 Tax=Proteus mirabilis TaxID=584 RepID=UPI0034D6C347
MLTLKIMSAENIADSNTSKGFKLIPVADGTHVEFRRNQLSRKGFVHILNAEDEVSKRIKVEGNCYVLEAGKTIASFSSAPYYAGGDEFVGTLATDSDYIDVDKFYDFFSKDPGYCVLKENEENFINEVVSTLNMLSKHTRQLLTEEDTLYKTYPVSATAPWLAVLSDWLMRNYGLCLSTLSNGTKSSEIDDIIITGWFVEYFEDAKDMEEAFIDGSPVIRDADGHITNKDSAVVNATLA